MNFPYTLLAVDHNSTNLEKISQTFEGLYEVLTATNGTEAMEIFSRQPIQIVIVDQHLTGIDPIELLERFKRLNQKTIRIFITSSKDLNSINDAIKRGGVYRCFIRPWSSKELRSAVQNALRDHNSHDLEKELTVNLKIENQRLKQRTQSLSELMDKYEEIQEKLFELERFSAIGKTAAYIIHDMKQPLDIIQSSVDSLAHLELTATEKKDIAKIVKAELNRFQEMIHGVLDYTRGNFSLDYRKMSARQLFSKIDTDIRNYLATQHIEYSSFFDHRETVIRVDITRFQRALMNLVKNAVEALKGYPEQSSPHISFRVGTEAGCEWVKFTIGDNGPGIPEEIKSKVFQPFISLKKDSGIGLGLSIVKKIIEEHHGSISFISHKGSGSEFIIRLKNLVSKPKLITADHLSDVEPVSQN